MSEKPFTPISKVGEFGLIRQLTEKIILKNSSTIKGVGDDAAVIAPEKDTLVLFSTDMFAEGIHFDLTYTPLRHLGYKAVSANVSDICAMNGIPTQIVVSLAISNQFSVEAIEEIYKGIQYAAEEYDIDLVGGDTISSNSGLVINIAIIGKAGKDRVTYRNTAKPGDIICVSGDLGGAYAGLMVLERGKKAFGKDEENKIDLANYEYPLKRQLMPQARKDIVELFQELDILPNSMIDISDGLSSELHHICEDSGVGCLIYEERIPVNPATKKVAEEFSQRDPFGKSTPIAFALSGGEDYELLFTVAPLEVEKLRATKKITPIGEVVPKKDGMHLLDKTGKMNELSAKGWDAFEK